jgi:hypothetical protein
MAESIALSLKQPWAALLASGRKTIEIRRWPTKRRGPVLIHAARNADDRDYAWSLVPPELMAKAKLAGGIIGAAELTDCVTYRTIKAFQADQQLHCNLPEWFQPPGMFGFRFVQAEFVSYRRLPGNIRFFTVTEVAEDSGQSDLLFS